MRKRTQMHRQKYKRVRISKYVELKSGLEEAVYKFLNNNNCMFVYEGIKIAYSSPETKKTYTPDFPISKCNIIVETKELFNQQIEKR